METKPEAYTPMENMLTRRKNLFKSDSSLFSVKAQDAAIYAATFVAFICFLDPNFLAFALMMLLNHARSDNIGT